MKRLKMTIELECDDRLFNESDPEEVSWFFNYVMKKKLLLHSNEIGDVVGTVKVIKCDNLTMEGKG